MRIQSSSTIRVAAAGVLLVCVSPFGLAYAQAVKLSVTADRNEILAGEPLVMDVVLKNESQNPVWVRPDSTGLPRITRGPDGSQTVSTTPPTPPDAGYFSISVKPGEQETIRIVAKETSRFQHPGEYRMTVQFTPLQLFGEYKFTVRSYDESALRARAYQLLGPAADPLADNHRWSLDALEAIEPAISRPLLCDLLRRNPEAYSVPIRLEEFGDAGSIDCLIDSLPAAQGLQRQVIEGALERLSRSTKDGVLHARILRALEVSR